MPAANSRDRYRREQLYVVEPRKPDGTLNARDNYACSLVYAIEGVTEHELFAPFFAAHPGRESASWDELRAWLESRGWYVREKYW